MVIIHLLTGMILQVVFQITDLNLRSFNFMRRFFFGVWRPPTEATGLLCGCAGNRSFPNHTLYAHQWQRRMKGGMMPEEGMKGGRLIFFFSGEYEFVEALLLNLP